ncbi:creatininase family protein [Paenibacillus spongiae]|uniref:Creatininase family protein n=1 Tax=Paenibacillus spongiae TaxID=2909671 RepID=A0ABY5S742_9BACL|nr:creatininase family protein [Paenibacillus spongiae]UVI29318.1 creatininase family protein [Paenibacillus spongiae]
MVTRYSGKAWDRHFLPRLSKLEVERIPKDRAVVVLPVGAVEQHGPHLPVYTDTLIGEGFITHAFEEIPDGEEIWLLPPLSYGKSTEHLGHYGTISLSATTLMAMLTDISRSLQRSGFKKLVLVNTHGGNTDLLGMMAREIRIDTGLAVFRLDPGFGYADDSFDEEELMTGIHGGAVETSLILAAREHWVHMELATEERPNFPESDFLQFKRRAFAWVIDDISASGISGNAKLASAESGRTMFRKGGKLLAEGLMAIMRFNMEDVKNGAAVNV